MQRPESFANYSDFLHGILIERSQRNPLYSLRAFARDLDMSPARISTVLQSKGHLSPASALAIAGKLGLDKKATGVFVNQVKAFSSKSLKQRQLAKESLAKIKASQTGHQLLEAEFKNISEWYFLGVYNFLLIGRQNKFSEILSEFPMLSEDQLYACLKIFIRLDLVKLQEGKYIALEENLNALYSFHSIAVRRYHKSMLELCKDRIDHQTRDERYLHSRVLRLTPQQYKDLAQHFDSFLSGLRPKFNLESENESEAVYAINMQMFRLNSSKEL